MELSAGLPLMPPTSFDPELLSHSSTAVLTLASAAVAFGFCHSADEDEDLLPAGVSDTMAR